jgi:hypothetical protein
MLYRGRMHWDLGTRLFEIPVYRVSPERWEEEREQELSRYIKDDDSEERRLRWHWLFNDKYGLYPYNQIIGWVHVGWVGPRGHIKCYYFRIPTKRIGRHFRQGRVREMGKIFELHVGYKKTSAEMLAAIRSALTSQTGVRGSLRGRYLDFEVFDNLTPALDLKTLLADPPSPPFRATTPY